MERKCPSRLMVNVAVIISLLVNPLIGTVFDPLAASALLETGMYFHGVWSKLGNNDSGMSFSSIFLTILCKYTFSSSLHRAPRIVTLPVVVNLIPNFILPNKICAQLDSPKPIWFRLISRYRLINALATDMAMVLLTIAPRAWTT